MKYVFIQEHLANENTSLTFLWGRDQIWVFGVSQVFRQSLSFCVQELVLELVLELALDAAQEKGFQPNAAHHAQADSTNLRKARVSSFSQRGS